MSAFFTWLYNNKQAILGSLVAGLAFIQGNDALKDLLSEAAYAWTMFGVGLLSVLFARSTAGGVVSKVLPPSIPPAPPGG